MTRRNGKVIWSPLVPIMTFCCVYFSNNCARRRVHFKTVFVLSVILPHSHSSTRLTAHQGSAQISSVLFRFNQNGSVFKSRNSRTSQMNILWFLKKSILSIFSCFLSRLLKADGVRGASETKNRMESFSHPQRDKQILLLLRLFLHHWKSRWTSIINLLISTFPFQHSPEWLIHLDKGLWSLVRREKCFVWLGQIAACGIFVNQ